MENANLLIYNKISKNSKLSSRQPKTTIKQPVVKKCLLKPFSFNFIFLESSSRQLCLVHFNLYVLNFIKKQFFLRMEGGRISFNEVIINPKGISFNQIDKIKICKLYNILKR